jgi:hypothetical protein
MANEYEMVITLYTPQYFEEFTEWVDNDLKVDSWWGIIDTKHPKLHVVYTDGIINDSKKINRKRVLKRVVKGLNRLGCAYDIKFVDTK